MTTVNEKWFLFWVCGTEAEIQLPLKRSSRFQRLFPNPSWLVWGRASRHQKLAPTFPGIDSCLMVTKRDFLEMEASLWLNGKSQNVAKGWLPTKCCWEAAVHTLDLSWKKMDVKLMMMMMMSHKGKSQFYIFLQYWFWLVLCAMVV